MAQKYLVNWTDNMALRASRLHQQDDFFIDHIRESVSIRTNSYNYGLLPFDSHMGVEHGIQINQQITDRIEIKLVFCNAITSSGFRVDFHASNGTSELIKSYSIKSDIEKNITQWDIILSVDPFDREAFGPPDPHETPPRHPNSRPTYKLFVMPKGEIHLNELGSHYLTIGRIRKDSNRFAVDSAFIPPCTTINSHPELMNYYTSFGQIFRGLEGSNKLIISKINERASKDPLANNILKVCSEVERFIADISFDYRNKAESYPPVDIIGYVSRLAHHIYSNLCFLTPIQKEDVLKYFYEWSDISPGSFEEMTANTLELVYDHSDIRASMVQSNIFLHNILDLWQRLSTLQYIGQHKESIVVSERTSTSSVATSNKIWGGV